MKTIAVYNIKGGVGKTATAVNLSYLAAMQGARTLIWDLDPQAATSYYFRVKPRIKGGGRSLIEGKSDLDDAIRGTDYEYLDLLPADFSYRDMDIILEHTSKPTRRLHKLLKPLAEDYDYIFLDCPPSISSATESVFAAADILLVPTIPTTLSLRTFKQIRKFFKQQTFGRLAVLPFFAMVDRRKQLHRLIVDHPPAFMADVLKTRIPYASEVERMGVNRAPVAEFAPASRAARSYSAMWEELHPVLQTTTSGEI